MQEPSYCLAGGTRAAVSLVEPITQIISQVQKIAHPNSRALLSIVNGVYGAAKHLDGDLFKLGNTSGTMVSRKSALQVIDRCTSGKNKVREGLNMQIKYILTLKVVLSWKQAEEQLWESHPDSLARRKAMAHLLHIFGFTVIVDNIGWVENYSLWTTKL